MLMTKDLIAFNVKIIFDINIEAQKMVLQNA